jgi:hypothetical protein
VEFAGSPDGLLSTRYVPSAQQSQKSLLLSAEVGCNDALLKTAGWLLKR